MESFYQLPVQSVFGGCTIDDTFCHRVVEDSFCRDFSCCGLELGDLHDLLQHHEECHVLFEAEDDWTLNLYNEDEMSAPGTPPTCKKQCTSSSLSDMSWEETASDNGEAKIPVLNNSVRKPSPRKQRRLDLLDTTRPSSTASKNVCTTQEDTCLSALSTPMSSAPTTPSALKSPSPVTIAANSDPLDPSVTLFPRTSYFAMTGDLSMQLEELYSASKKNLDEQHKCSVDGCDKAYKNANALKYHTMNRHGGLRIPACKPYKCTVLDCGKRFKHLNGLKYHIEHSHVLMNK